MWHVHVHVHVHVQCAVHAVRAYAYGMHTVRVQCIRSGRAWSTSAGSEPTPPKSPPVSSPVSPHCDELRSRCSASTNISSSCSRLLCSGEPFHALHIHCTRMVHVHCMCMCICIAQRRAPSTRRTCITHQRATPM